MAQLRNRRANRARGFHIHAIVAVCRKMDVRFSITARQHQSVLSAMEAIPEADWTPMPYWMDGAADVAETEYTPFASKSDAGTGPHCSSRPSSADTRLRDASLDDGVERWIVRVSAARVSAETVKPVATPLPPPKPSACRTTGGFHRHGPSR